MGTPHLPQSGTELEEFFDLTIDPRASSASTATSAREPVVRAHPRVSEAGALLAVGARHPHPDDVSHRERRWRSSRRVTIWSGSNRASAAPERFGEFALAVAKSLPARRTS